MDSAKANRIAITVVIGLIIVGTIVFLIFDQIQPRKESKVEIVRDAPQKLDLTNDVVRPEPRRVVPAPAALPQLNLLLLDGTPLKLSDYAGKIVFLHIWSTKDPLSLQELSSLKPIYDRFLLDSRFQMIGICADADAATI